MNQHDGVQHQNHDRLSVSIRSFHSSEDMQSSERDAHSERNEDQEEHQNSDQDDN